MKLVQFNFRNYFENPIVQFCQKQLKKELPNAEHIVYTLEELEPLIKTLNHSKHHYQINNLSYIGDQLRLYLAMQDDDFFYADGDVFFPTMETILKNKNCTDFEQIDRWWYKINNGTFFYTDKDCRFNKYYQDLYQEKGSSLHGSNISVFNQYPFEMNLENRMSGDMHLLETENLHFLTSTYVGFASKYLNNDTVLYCIDKDPPLRAYYGAPLIVFGDKKNMVACGSNTYLTIHYPYIDEETLIELHKEQLQHSVGHKINFVQLSEEMYRKSL